MIRFIAQILFAAVLFSAPLSAHAASSEWVTKDHVRARLISAVSATGNQATVVAGIDVDMEEGWKTYWRVPGDAGLAPVFDWAGSRNLDGAKILWPAPKRFTDQGFESFGYEHEIVFPAEIALTAPRQGLNLKLGLDVLVCNEICVPVRFDLSLTIPPGKPIVAAEHDLIESYIRHVPVKPLAEEFAFGQVFADDSQDPPVLVIEGFAKTAPETPDVFIEAADLSFGAPTWNYEPVEKTIRLFAPLNTAVDEGETLGSLIADAPLHLTYADGASVFESDILPGLPKTDTALPTTFSSSALLPYLIAAFIGGLILNLMPCVLPVLSLKLLSIVSHGGSTPRAVRKGFLASALGILFSFMVMAGLLVALKATGNVIGWGIQFQQPVFLAFILVLLTLFGLNLWGAYEIPLPRFIARTASKTHEHEPTLLGHFLTGAFATLLATPCTAPFLGTAVGFALAQNAFQIFVIFATIGLGLGAPYLAVALVPAVAKLLPRPGRWMITFKKILAIALGLTALWIVVVIKSIAGPLTALTMVFLMAASTIVVCTPFKISARLKQLIIVLIAATALFAALTAPKVTLVSKQQDDGAWQVFSESETARLAASGKIVFVDVTAEWCLTCKANKKFVLDTPGVSALFENHGVVLMRADWTKPSDEVSAYLAKFGRFGIPFNAVYGPKAKNGIALPELLSYDAIEEAIGKAD